MWRAAAEPERDWARRPTRPARQPYAASGRSSSSEGSTASTVSVMCSVSCPVCLFPNHQAAASFAAGTVTALVRPPGAELLLLVTLGRAHIIETGAEPYRFRRALADPKRRKKTGVRWAILGKRMGQNRLPEVPAHRDRPRRPARSVLQGVVRAIESFPGVGTASTLATALPA